LAYHGSLGWFWKVKGPGLAIIILAIQQALDAQLHDGDRERRTPKRKPSSEKANLERRRKP